MLKGIENIIFDLGGVIINLNQDLTSRAFQQLFPNNFNLVINEAQSVQLFEKFETNHFSSDEFIQFFKKYDNTINDNQIIHAWNSMLLDIPVERISLIKKLSTNYKCFLLSNTNQIHYNYIEKYYKTHYKNESFSTLFSKTFLSYQMKCRKPEKEIFNKVLNEANLNPSTTLFIDDSLEHINTAKKLDINAFHLDLNKNQTLSHFFL